MSASLREPAPPPPAADVEVLARQQRPAVWRYLRVLGCDAATADDLAQEVFLVVLRRPTFTASEPGAAFAFLRTTARHLWMKHRRRRIVEREIEEADRVWDARCGDGDGEDYVEALRQCVAGLPPRSRALLAATYADGAGRAASAGRFGMSKDGIKSALRRLRAFLHACIERRLEESP